MINAVQKRLIWCKLCLDALTILLVGVGLMRRMLDQVRPSKHSRRAKKIVWVGNARRQARLPIQVQYAVWRVIFFTYLLTVDATGLHNISGLPVDEAPMRSAGNGTSADSGVELLHRAVWAQVVAQRHLVHGGDVPVQIFAAQERWSFVVNADLLLEPDLNWAVSRLHEAGVNFGSHLLMPVIPQPSMITCSLLLMDRCEENAVILVGNDVFDVHVVPKRMPLFQLQHTLGVSLCSDHCQQHFPSDHTELRVVNGFV